jgi:hypothetical protein
MRYRFLLGLLLVWEVLLGAAPRVSRADGTTFTDPFAYCAAVGTIDAPDARYIGPHVPEVIARGLQAALGVPPTAPLDPLLTNSVWRCMQGTVYACTFGANLPCLEQADTRQTPTPAMVRFCQANPNAAIPAVVTGRRTVYAWHCQHGVATIIQQVTQPDARGFFATIWYAINPPHAGIPQVMPGTGSLSFFSPSLALLGALGAAAVAGGCGIRRRAERS